MARAPKKTSESTAVANWDEELARQAAIAEKMEANVGGGQFFSIRGGTLSFNDSPVPGNRMAVVIADHVLENVYYEGDFDPNVLSPPTCFAFGRDEDDIAPHEVVVKAGQNQDDGAGACKGCPLNAWGTADKGRGKACRNTRRLALIPAGQFDSSGRFTAVTDVDHFQTSALAYMKLPVTSVKGFASFVKSVAGSLRRPPHGIFTSIKVEPDPKNQVRVVFEPLSAVPNNLLAAIMKRHQESQSTIGFPYNLERDEAPAAPAKRGRGKAAPAAPAKRAGRRY